MSRLLETDPAMSQPWHQLVSRLFHSSGAQIEGFNIQSLKVRSFPRIEFVMVLVQIPVDIGEARPNPG